MGKWIEVINTSGDIELINLNKLTNIGLKSDIVYLSDVGGNYSKIYFDNKYDSLVDFINSKRVDM